MDPFLTIGQVARSLDVPTSTLRFLEREGLLAPTCRTAAGYRQFDPAGVQRVRFIRAAQSLGFSLSDIKMLVGLAETDDCARVQTIAHARLRELDAKMASLQAIRDALVSALDRCAGATERCPVLHDLNAPRVQADH